MIQPGTVAGTISVEEVKAMTSQIERVKKALDELTDRINYLEYWMNRITSD
jgi:cell division protein FtsB